MSTSTNRYPVDSDNITRGAGIPADDLDRLIAASAGPASLPAGFLTDDDDETAALCTYVGPPHTVPGRKTGAYAVAILDRDGQISDSFVTVELGETEERFSLHQVRTLACALTAAADDLLACDPTQPLDTISTAALCGEVARRISGPGALREAIKAADPAALTGEDRRALLDLLGAAFDAAGIE